MERPMETAVFVGSDVAKAYLDVASRPAGVAERLPNDEPGIAQLVARLVTVSPTLIVLEATGGLEVPAATTLAAAGFAVAVVNPARSATSPRPSVNWRRPMPSTPGCWPTSPR